MKKKEEKPKKMPLHHIKEQPEGSFEVDEGLRSIYGETPKDLHVVERGVSPLTYWLSRIVVGLCIFAVFLGAGIFIMSKGYFGNKNSAPLEMSVTVPEGVRSGDTVTIEVPYQNTESVPIASLEIDVNVPASFKITSLSPAPTNEAELIFTIGSLGSHSDGKIALTGVWIAEAPSSTNVQAIASYRPGNFNSIFSSIATGSVNTKESVLKETVTGPDSGIPGQSLTYSVTIEHAGEVPLDNVQLEMIFPAGFTVSGSVPPLPAAAAPLWNLGTLAPHTKTVVTITGAFSSEVSDVQTIAANTRVAFTPTEMLTQATSNHVTDVKGGSLRLSLVGNGLTGTVGTEPGSALKLSFRLENAGTAPVADATVVLDFEPGTGVPITWSSASLDGGTLSAEGVKFDPKKIGALAPGEKKTFNLSFPIKSTLAATDLDTFTVVAKAATATTNLLSTPITVNLSAGVALEAFAHYYSADGAPIGSGPMPPKVNEETTYEVVFTINHSLHALDDLVLSATLPPGVTFAGNSVADMGELSYDEVNRTIGWHVTSIPSDTGMLSAKFFISATPGPEDEDTFMKLLSATSLRAADDKTGARIDRTNDALTTELPKDTFAAGKGTVTQ